MSEKSDARSADLKAWLLMHAARDLAFYLQDRIVPVAESLVI